MGDLSPLVVMMKFLLAVAVLTVVGAHAASDIVVKVDQEELSPLLRTFCCGSMQQRCARTCTGRSCSLRCQGYCGIFNSMCCPYTCSSVTNACQQTTTTTTTAAATTAAETTAAETTAAETTAAETPAAETTAAETTAAETTAAETTAAKTTAAETAAAAETTA